MSAQYPEHVPLHSIGNGHESSPSSSPVSFSYGAHQPLLANDVESPPATAAAAVRVDKYGKVLPPLHQASLFACTAAMANTILGAGMLGLPHAMAESGFMVGMILLCCAGGAAAFALHLLSVSAKTVGVFPSSFFVVASRAVPKATFLIDLAVAIKCFGVGTSFLIVIGDLVPEAVRSLAGSHNLPGFIVDRRFWILLYACSIVLPLSCLRSLNALRFTAMVSIFFVAFLTGVIGLYAVIPNLDECAGFASKEVCRGPTHFIVAEKGTLKVISIFIFAFTCHQNIFSACNELSNFTIPRINRVISGCIGLAWVIYCIIALGAYSTYGSLIKPDVLQNYPNSVMFAMARLLIATNCAFTYPLQCNPCRNSIALLMYQWDHRNDSDKTVAEPHNPSETRLSILTVLICLGSLGISMVVSDLGVILSIVGATGSTTISYILPGLIFLKLHGKEPWTFKHYAAAALLGMGCVIIPSCLTFIFI